MMIFNSEKSDQYLELLNKHFKTECFAKHPKVMLQLLFERATKEVLGSKINKKRVSKRNQVRLYEYILDNLQSCYGRWVNLTNFKAKTLDSIRFRCNLAYAYKNVLGVVYAPTGTFTAQDILYTGHSFERFEERADPELLAPMYYHLGKSQRAKVNAADVLFVLVDMCSFEYAIKDRFRFLNVQIGVLVLEDYDDLFIAKTFLAPKMADLSVQWYKPKFGDLGKLPVWGQYGALREIMELERTPVKPVFGIESFINAMSGESQPEEKEAEDEPDD